MSTRQYRKLRYGLRPFPTSCVILGMYKLIKPGIPAIRSAVHSACPLLAQLSLRQQRDTISQKILTGKQHFELITRRAVAESFPEIDLQLPSTQREKLYKALFEVCFPLEIVVDKEVR